MHPSDGAPVLGIPIGNRAVLLAGAERKEDEPIALPRFLASLGLGGENRIVGKHTTIDQRHKTFLRPAAMMPPVEVPAIKSKALCSGSPSSCFANSTRMTAAMMPRIPPMKE